MSISEGVINEIETRLTTRDPVIHLLLAAAFQYLSISTGESFGAIFAEGITPSYWLVSGVVTFLTSCLLINEKFKYDREEITKSSPKALLNSSAVSAEKPVKILLLVGYLIAIYQFVIEIQTLGETQITASMVGVAVLFHALIISATQGLMRRPWKWYVVKFV